MTTMTKSTSTKLPSLTLQTSTPPTLKSRGRSSSIVKVEQVGPRSQEEVLDQSAYVNINAEWVNSKGAWMIHPVLIVAGKILLDTIPGMTPQISWTLTNLLYISLSYLVFHWATGIPFDSELHGGAYDDLTLWEQIDEGAQYTPAKKWLISVPILLFLASTHYTHYDPWLFAINLTTLVVGGLLPKLPQFHRQRVRFMTEHQSGFSTPITPGFPTGSGIPTPTGAPSAPSPLLPSEADFRRR